jgi:crotonobetainyl-CoA:carnitine CoA-transferase CaiB-like acyl-CoA transferase
VTAAAPGPLDDITVVEVANWVAAPSCAALLADMGARVVKIEPPGGDAMRSKLRGPKAVDGVVHADYPFQLDNRGKRSIAVDLTDPRGAELVRDLAGRADVFVTNLLPGRRERYGLTADALLAVNPRLVYALLTGYGSRGPDADLVGFDQTAFFARSGIMSLVGEPGEPPPKFPTGQGDHPTGLALLAAILAALRVRDRTGVGQVVETALLRTAVWSIASDVATALVDRRQPTRRGRLGAVGPMNTTYRCADGAWVNLSAADQSAWPRFCRALDRPDLADDPRYETLRDRFDQRVELIAEFDRVFGSQPYPHWAPRLESVGLVWAKVATLPDLVDDEQVRANDMFVRVEHPVTGPFETVAAPFTMSASDASVRGPAPEPGEHTRSVLAELGLSAARIDELQAAGVIATGTA